MVQRAPFEDFEICWSAESRSAIKMSVIALVVSDIIFAWISSSNDNVRNVPIASGIEIFEIRHVHVCFE